MRTTLETEYRRIRATASRIAELLSDRSDPGEAFSGPLRCEFARMLMQHMRFKDAMVYAPLLRAGLSQQTAVAGLHARCRMLYQDYERHLAFWTDARIGEDWPAYRTGALDLIVRLHRAIELERRVLYPLLENGEPGVRAAA